MKKYRTNLKNSDCLETSIKVMKITGVWIPEDLQHPWDLLYKLFAFSVQFILFFLIILAEIVYVFTNIGNTAQALDAAVLLFSHLVQGVKVLVIFTNQQRIKRLIQMIDSPEFNKTDKRLQSILEQSTALASTVGRVVIASAAITAVFWAIVPALKTELTLPLKIACPFDISNPIVFAIMYAYTTVAVFTVGVGDASENYLVSGLFTLGSAQVDVLCEELRSLGPDDDKLEENTVACIKYHQNIISYVDELASIFGVSMFFQFLTTSIVMCMTIYKITITREPIEMVTMVFYLACVLIELFMYCYPGDILLSKSLLISEAAYPQDWARSVNSRRMLLMTTLRAQRPLAVDAGGMFRVCLPTAAGVVQTSYSYYAMLRQKVG